MGLPAPFVPPLTPENRPGFPSGNQSGPNLATSRAAQRPAAWAPDGSGRCLPARQPRPAPSPRAAGRPGSSTSAACHVSALHRPHRAPRPPRPGSLRRRLAGHWLLLVRCRLGSPGLPTAHPAQSARRTARCDCGPKARGSVPGRSSPGKPARGGPAANNNAGNSLRSLSTGRRATPSPSGRRHSCGARRRPPKKRQKEPTAACRAPSVPQRRQVLTLPSDRQAAGLKIRNNGQTLPNPPGLSGPQIHPARNFRPARLPRCWPAREQAHSVP